MEVLIFGIVIGIIVGILLMQIFALKNKASIQKRAVQGAKNSIFGEVYEKVLPVLPDFPYLPKDMVFVGKGCDYIIFDGLSEGNLREVIFLEVKSGKAQLNTNERAIKQIISQKLVRFTEFRINNKKNI